MIKSTSSGESLNRDIHAYLERLHLVEFSSKKAGVLQSTELTAEQTNMLKKLKINPPPLIYQVDLKA